MSHLYDLAEALAADIAVLAPDWCQIAQNAQELAAGAQRRCGESDGLEPVNSNT